MAESRPSCLGMIFKATRRFIVVCWATIDASPAAAAQEIEELVLADGKHAGPGQQLFRLPAGQEILLHQAAEERFGIVALIGGLASLGELLGREQMALLQ